MQSRRVLLVIVIICAASALVFFWLWSRPGTTDTHWGLLGPIKGHGTGPPSQAQLADRYRRLCEILYGRRVPAPEKTERHQWGEPEGDVLSLGRPIVVNFMADTGRVRGVYDHDTFISGENAKGPSSGPEPADPAGRNRYTDLALALFQRLGVDHTALVLDSVAKSTYKGQKRLVGRWATVYDGIAHEHEGMLLAFDVTAPEPVFDTLGFGGVRPIPTPSGPLIEEKEAVRIATECATDYIKRNAPGATFELSTAATRKRYVYRNGFFIFPSPPLEPYEMSRKKPETHLAYIVELTAKAPGVTNSESKRAIWLWVDCYTGEVVGGDMQS